MLKETQTTTFEITYDDSIVDVTSLQTELEALQAQERQALHQQRLERTKQFLGTSLHVTGRVIAERGTAALLNTELAARWLVREIVLDATNQKPDPYDC